MPSWEPKRVLKCPLSWQNTLNCPHGWLKHDKLPSLVAKTWAKVPSWEPKRALQCPYFRPCLQKVCARHCLWTCPGGWTEGWLWIASQCVLGQENIEKLKKIYWKTWIDYILGHECHHAATILWPVVCGSLGCSTRSLSVCLDLVLIKWVSPVLEFIGNCLDCLNVCVKLQSDFKRWAYIYIFASNFITESASGVAFNAKLFYYVVSVWINEKPLVGLYETSCRLIHKPFYMKLRGTAT